MRRIDLTGNKYARLSVEKYSHTDRRGQAFWLCKCECGKEVIVRGTYLRNGHTQSCGCFNIERTVETSKTHGNFLNGKQTRIYGIWAGIKRRCLNPHVKAYKHYGRRGITLCDEWMSFETFMDWALSNGYKDNLTIDRISGDGNYEPSNCRWITRSENSRKGAIEAYNRRRENS